MQQAEAVSEGLRHLRRCWQNLVAFAQDLARQLLAWFRQKVLSTWKTPYFCFFWEKIIF